MENKEFATPDLICVLHSWLHRCRDARDGHYKKAESLFELSQVLGYVLIYSTVFVTVFSFSPHKPSDLILWGITKQHAIILIGCIAAVISGIVTQARFGERSEMHRSSGARYANLARDIEELQMKINEGMINNYTLSMQTSLIIKEWNNLSEDSLLTPHNPAHSKKIYNTVIILFFILLFFLVAI
ncbi:SLATT domain-containing protein [Aeromonas hydrophila]|uniref:SLATT domain-containing protein n=1 Tax=Aeromonas hydrophila TaxID=644 RepID=UPI0009BA2848|nr:SLATT domain-containing protein [Aeromonas hydrophila]